MSSTVKTRKKLIEVALPLEAINIAAAREKGNPFLKGHPRSLHQWWARRPQGAARAVIFAQMVDDPSSHPEIFKTEKAQEKERQRLFKIVEELAQWENSDNEKVLEQAKAEIWQSWRSACADYVDHPRAKELFDRHKLPAFHDPFSGGGALPLEAQRLGLESYASDLNPVAVLINKALIEIPPTFAGNPPVNPEAQSKRELIAREWRGAQGLAEDLRYYSQWMRDETEKRIGHLYPMVEVTPEMAKDRPDLKPHVGKNLNVIAWLWARTVKSPNPAFAHLDVPLASTFTLSIKAGKEAYISPIVEADGYRFRVLASKPDDADGTGNGTKLARGANFRCLMSGIPITGDYIKAEGTAGRIGARMMAVVAEGEPGRVYLPPTLAMEEMALKALPDWKPEGAMVEDARAFTPFLYGLLNWGDLFSSRQLVALTTLSNLVTEVHARVKRDAVAAGMAEQQDVDTRSRNAIAYGDAVAILVALCVDKVADYNNTICMWNPTNENVGHLFTKQVIAMTWDYVESSPIHGGLSFETIAKGVAKSIEMLPAATPGRAVQADACESFGVEKSMVLSTDPPYFDNVPYADLSDFFYAWLRRSLKSVLPDLFVTLAAPKDEELVATPYRHGGRAQAEAFFMNGMTQAMHRLAEQAHPAFPVTIYYAFKQSETEGAGTASTGWEAFLDAVSRAGFALSGTWPMRTERATRSRGINSNALASSIVLVCRPRSLNAPSATRREFITALKAELPSALVDLQRGNIAPVDLAQAAIGPGMAVYTRYAAVLEADGKPLSVRDALALINQTLDEALAEQEGDFDADTRWAVAWFEQSGFATGDYGVAETLSKAKNTSVAGMMDAGILSSGGGKVRLLKPEELNADWEPETDTRKPVWEALHHLVRALSRGGETAAAALAARLGSRADAARELAYRLYILCERKHRAQEALAYNALVQSWPEIQRLASEAESRPAQPQQTSMFS